MPAGSVGGSWLGGRVVRRVALVKLGEGGTVKIAGKGWKTTKKKGLKAGTHTITVPLTATGRAAKQHKIKATLTVAHRIGTATATVKAWMAGLKIVCLEGRTGRRERQAGAMCHC